MIEKVIMKNKTDIVILLKDGFDALEPVDNAGVEIELIF